MKSEDHGFLFISVLTLLVSFCSIIYELLYSQALTVLYGGTVARYSITIGLYLISLGLGSFFYNAFGFKNNRVFFWWNELFLSLAGPLGVVGIFALSAASLRAGLASQTPVFLASHAPILIVGILSGIEIPLLVGLLNPEEKDKFSKILGLDYVGSFLGTVIYSLVLYPRLGLVSTALWVGFLNAFSTALYAFRRMEKEIFLKILSVLFLILYLLLLFFSDNLQTWVLRGYRQSQISAQYQKLDPSIRSVRVTETFSTPYQDVTLYETTSDRGVLDHCLNLDAHVQVCDSTYEAYHAGLVDVPMLFLRGENLKALLVGGGDFIAADVLLKYPSITSIDQVDIDGRFMEYMKKEPHFRTLHHEAYRDPRLRTVVEDGFSFMRLNQKKYDLILIDLPGIDHEKLAPLYSVEFYLFLRRALTDNGVISGWMYGASPRARRHYEAFMNTIREAGFKTHILYDAYQAEDGSLVPAQPFYLLTSDNHNEAALPPTPSSYLTRTFSLYQNLYWTDLPSFRHVRPNTVLKPNYDILLKD